MRRLIPIALLWTLLAAPAQAQLAVIDPGQIAQLVVLIYQVESTIDLLREGQVTLDRMRRGVPNLGRYRLPDVPIGTHPIFMYPHAAALLEGMNVGDRNGIGWQLATQRLQIPADLFNGLGPAGQAALRAAYATVEVIDSTNILAANQVGRTRVYSGELQQRIDFLANDVINGVSEPTANLDKLAIAAMLRNRQQMAATQLLSSLVDQLIGTAKSKRDADVELLNSQISALRERGEDTTGLEGTANILANWSLP